VCSDNPGTLEANIAIWSSTETAPATCADTRDQGGTTAAGCSANPIDQDATPEVDDMRWEILRATSAITLDADLSDWVGIPFKAQTPFRPCDKVDGTPCVAPFVEFDVCTACKSTFTQATWSGPADHSAAIALAWTTEALHAGVKVFDDTHQNPGGENGGWNGDSVMFMFANAARTQGGTDRTGEIDTPGGMILYNFGVSDSDGSYALHHESTPCSDECAQMAYRRDDANMITTYEFVFPAGALGQDSLELGFTFGLGIVVNDGDTDPGQAGQSGWSGWAPYGSVHGGRQTENNGLAALVRDASSPTPCSACEGVMSGPPHSACDYHYHYDATHAHTGGHARPCGTSTTALTQFDWIELNNLGTKIADDEWTGDGDDGWFDVELRGMCVYWFGICENKITIGTNGLVTFGAPHITNGGTEPLPCSRRGSCTNGQDGLGIDGLLAVCLLPNPH
jgi:hypothetical protein